MSKDYAEILLQAVDTLYNKRVESIKFDTTDSATIIERVDADQGKYIVSTGTTKYVAYSVNTDYRVGDNVYVTIPNGDYEQQKIIIGKQVTNNSQPFVYTAPFSTIVNISENLIPKTADIKGGLRANCYYDQPEQFLEAEVQNNQGEIQKKIWERTFDKENLVGYTRLGIQGQFMSWLYHWRVISGDYGLKLVLTYKIKNCESYLENYNETLYKLKEIETFNNNQDKVNNWNWVLYNSFIPVEQNLELNNGNINALIKITEDLLNSLEGTRTLFLGCSDFYGDPYNFNTYFQQEAVFDISSLGEEAQITKMELYFYQVPGSFFRQNEQPVPYRPEDSPFGDEETGFLDYNLFIKDPYICVGFGVGEFTEDDVSLYTVDSLTYSYKIPDNYSEEDWLKKTIQLRWIHEYPDGTISEVKNNSTNSELPELNYEIRWYRYELGAPAPDPYAGVYWKRIPRIREGSTLEEDFKSFSYEVKGDYKLRHDLPEEKFKVIILLYELSDDQKKYCLDIYRSNTLTFINEDEVISQKILDQISGFFLETNDASNGNYFIYGQSGHIKEQPDSKQIRQLQCFFKPSNKVTAELLASATKIIWRFPASNTMLHLADMFVSPIEESDWLLHARNRNINDVEWEIAPSFTINEYGKNSQNYTLEVSNISQGQSNSGVLYQIAWSKVCYDEETDEYVIGYKGDKNFAYFINPCICYTINSDYIASYTSNTISCTIEKDGITYTAYKTMRFGPAGTNGSPYTLIVEFDNVDNSSYVLTNGTEEEISVSAHLYDENKREKVNYVGHYEWSWLPLNNGKDINGQYVTIFQNDNQNELNDIITLYHDGETNLFDNILLYLECRLTGFGSYDLVTIVPAAVRSNENYIMRSGPTLVTYQSTGYPQYYTGPYTISERVNTDIGWNEITNGTWSVYNPDNVLENFLGQVDDITNTLKPCGVYVKEAGQYGVQYKINNNVIWVQPIYCCINEYPSSTLNEWDGKGIEINEDNGTIVAPAIAAGKKNRDNTFSGVMIGDWSKTDTEQSISKTTGVYGLDHGSVSYAFKEDGTAFIGKSGMGRILFDGTESSIKSEAYQQNSGGMNIDLDDGYIDIRGTIKTAGDPIKQGTWITQNNNSVSADGKGYYISGNTYSPSGSRVQISANGPTYLSVNTEHYNGASTLGTEILHVGSESYFLQSDDYLDRIGNPGDNDYQPARGTKIDLKTGNVVLANSITWSDSGDNKPYQVLYHRGVRHTTYLIVDDVNEQNFADLKSSLYVKSGSNYAQIDNNATFDPYQDYYKKGTGKNQYYYTIPTVFPDNTLSGYVSFTFGADGRDHINGWHSDFVEYSEENLISIMSSISSVFANYNIQGKLAIIHGLIQDFYGSDNYYSISYDSGQTWSKPQAINGHLDSSNIMAALLNNQSIDGIYNNGTDIGIRASAIRTGFLYSREGTLQSNDDTFAEIANKVGCVIDLDTGKFSLKGTTSGKKFFITPDGLDSVYGTNTYTVNGNSGNWVIFSGDGENNSTNGNFGVDMTGHVHAAAGTIGSWTIGSKYLASNLNTSNWTADTWLFSTNQYGSDGSNYNRTAASSTGRNNWRILIGLTDTNNPPSNTLAYNFGVDSNGNLFASNANITGTINVKKLFIDGQEVTCEEVTIPVAFKVVERSWDEYVYNATGGSKEVTLKDFLYGAGYGSYWEYKTLLFCRGVNTSGDVNDTISFTPSQLYGRASGYYGLNIYAHVPGTDLVYPWTDSVSVELSEFIGSHELINTSLTANISVPSYSTTPHTYYEAYISQVVRAKIYTQGTEGFDAHLEPVTNYLNPSGIAAYGLVRDGNYWVPTESVLLFKTGSKTLIDTEQIFLNSDIDYHTLNNLSL